MRNLLALLTAVLVAFSAVASLAENRPIVFIPGIIGSTLVEKTNRDQVIWGTLLSLRKSQTSKMNLLPGAGPPAELEPGDILRDFNLAFGQFEVGIYSHLVDFLVGKNQSAADAAFSPDLTEGVDFFVFSYDWRRSVFANGLLFAAFIEEKVPSGEFDIVAHSMGGLVTRAMLSDRRPQDRCVDAAASYPAGLSGADLASVCNAAYYDFSAQAWDNKPDLSGRLHSFVEVGVPHFGSVATVATMRSGAGNGLANRVLGGLTHLQDVSTSMVGVFELTPSYENCCWIKSTDDNSFKELNLFQDAFILDHWISKIVPVTVAPCAFSNCAQRIAIIEIGLANRVLLDQIMADKVPAGVSANHVLRGTRTSKTPSRYYVERPFRNAEDSIFVDTSLLGDGTVLEYSAKAPGQTPQAGVNEGLIAFTKHQALFSDSATKRYLSRFVIDEVVPPPVWSSVGPADPVIARAKIKAMNFGASPNIIEPGQDLPFEFVVDRLNADNNAFDPGALRDLRYSLRATRLDTGSDSGTDVQAQTLPDQLSLAAEEDLSAYFRATSTGPDVQGIYLYEILKDGNVYGQTTVYVLAAEG